MWVAAKDRNTSSLTGKRKTRNETALRVVNRCVLQRWPFDRDNPCGWGTEARHPHVPATVSPKPAGSSIGFAAIRVASLRMADRCRGSVGRPGRVPGSREGRSPRNRVLRPGSPRAGPFSHFLASARLASTWAMSL